jgi:TrmH family RNA methyltransferase
MPLSSLQNPQIQKVRRAVETGRPLENGAIAAEGPHLLAEALDSAWQVAQVFCSETARNRHPELFLRVLENQIEVTEVAERAFKTMSDTGQTQGVVALLLPRAFSWSELLTASGPLVILDGVQDPGNAGTIIRSTEAFGGGGVLFTEGCVRISNGKLLRAAAGSAFRLPFLEGLSIAEIVRHIKTGGRKIFSLTASGRIPLPEADLRAPFALVTGSEGRGVSEGFLAASETLAIPTRGVESLNAAIACSVALFEAARQSI